MSLEDWIVPQREREFAERAFAERAERELDSLELADQASRLLAELIQEVRVDASGEDRNPDELRRHALWLIAIITFRALRAAIHVFSIGYEDQAIGYQRLIDEAHNRAIKIADDTSGELAREWLAGRNHGKGAKLAGQDAWEFLSGPVHANVAAVHDWLAVSQPDGSARVTIGPERRPEMTDPGLTFMAGEARDIAYKLATSAEIVLDLKALDASIRAAQAKHIADNPQP
ncbi:MAG: hypothetical protein ACRDJX_04010 [Solirubrobacteraceae bacterium]